MGEIIGIDFGTTKSAVGAWIRGKPKIFTFENGAFSMPSEILVKGFGLQQEIFVGWDIKSKNKYNQDLHFIKAIKRMSTTSDDENEKWWYQFPQYSIAFILAELKLMAENFIGSEITDAVIAIPSHFDLNQRKVILEASEIANLNVRGLINEATSSVIAYSLKHNKKQNIFVVDIGGGTTDLSIVELFDGLYSVNYINGKTTLGGIDFSNALLGWLMMQIKEKYNIKTVSIEKATEIILFDEIERVKKELSENERSKIFLPWLCVEGKYLDYEFVINRNQFLIIAQKQFEELEILLDEVHKDYSKVIDKIILIGGASRTFGIKEMFRKKFKIEPFCGLNYETCVAEGAIVLSAILNGLYDGLILDCMQDDYGIELIDNQYEVFIKKNTTIPRTIKKEFVTTSDNQSNILLKIYKGSKPLASDNILLGTLELSDIPLSEKGTQKIIVTFNVNSSMNIAVSAINLNSGREVKTTLMSNNSIHPDLLTDMKKRLEIWVSRRKLGMN